MTAKVKPPKTWSEDHPGRGLLLVIGYVFLCPIGFITFLGVLGGEAGKEGFWSVLLVVWSLIALTVRLQKHRNSYYKARKDAERDKGDAERQRKAEELARARENRSAIIARRDADSQDRPYYYKIGRHGNETLALRYGIANISGKTALDSCPSRMITWLLVALRSSWQGRSCARSGRGCEHADFSAQAGDDDTEDPGRDPGEPQAGLDGL